MWLLCLLVEVTCRQRDDRLLTWAAHQARTARCTCSISVCAGHFYQNFVWHQFAEQERHALLAKPMQQLNGMSRSCGDELPPSVPDRHLLSTCSTDTGHRPEGSHHNLTCRSSAPIHAIGAVVPLHISHGTTISLPLLLQILPSVLLIFFLLLSPC